MYPKDYGANEKMIKHPARSELFDEKTIEGMDFDVRAGKTVGIFACVFMWGFVVAVGFGAK